MNHVYAKALLAGIAGFSVSYGIRYLMHIETPSVCVVIGERGKTQHLEEPKCPMCEEKTLWKTQIFGICMHGVEDAGDLYECEHCNFVTKRERHYHE